MRHSTTLTNLASLPLSDQIYNWFVNFFQDHSHCTRFLGSLSSSRTINASVFQGSVVGPPMYMIASMNLKPLYSGNYLDKYADDTYLIIPASNSSTVAAELNSIERWAERNNLKLNVSKSQEMIIYASSHANTKNLSIDSTPGIDRVQTLKILGVLVTSNLSMSEHVEAVCPTAARSLYVIKMLSSRGMNLDTAHVICQATVVSRLLYAAPAWWGFAWEEDKRRLQSILNRAIRWGFYKDNGPSLSEICEIREERLFSSILANPDHILYQFLPSEKHSIYNLRKRGHNRELPQKNNAFLARNFFMQMLYKDI